MVKWWEAYREWKSRIKCPRCNKTMTNTKENTLMCDNPKCSIIRVKIDKVGTFYEFSYATVI